MELLIAGIVLWSALHLMPLLQVRPRAILMDSLGANPYRGLFTMGIAISLALIVFGWREITPVDIYSPPAFAKKITSLFLLLGFLCIGAAKSKSTIRHYIRNPMLTGVVLWSVGHLISNGDQRSLILFGGIGVWAIVSIVLTNKRDGTWARPDKVPFKRELKGFAISLGVFLIFVLLHPFITGVSPAPH